MNIATEAVLGTRWVQGTVAHTVGVLHLGFGIRLLTGAGTNVSPN